MLRKIVFTIKTTIDGDFVLRSPISIQYCLMTISIFIENGIYKLSVSKDIELSDEELEECRADYYKGDWDGFENKYIDSKMIGVISHIEAFGGFLHAISRVHYNEDLELIWSLKENGEPILSIRKGLKARKKHILTEKSLSSLMSHKTLIPDAKAPYNFFREANCYLKRMDYVSAYIHFYMILEYCFADGQFSAKQKWNFIKSDKLRFSVLSTLNLYKDTNREIFTYIVQECKKKKDGFCYKTIIDVLYYIRGDLSHAPKRAEYEQNPEQIRLITLFISSVCFTVCGNMQVYCPKFISEERVARRLKEKIKMLEESLRHDENMLL